MTDTNLTQRAPSQTTHTPPTPVDKPLDHDTSYEFDAGRQTRLPEHATLPSLLHIPPKLMPMVFDFNKYGAFLLHGGRGSAKTHSIARFLLYVGDKRKIRVVCGREFQNSIEESVYTVLCDVIEQFSLPYEIRSTKILHPLTGTTFTFKGFRDQSRTNIKGLEGVDIVWVDEAQTLTDATLQYLLPTIRKNNSKFIFSMNRHLREDPVYVTFSGRADCLTIEINYYENPFCPDKLKLEAAELQKKNPREYDHVYLNIPLAASGEYIMDFEALYKSYDVQPYGAISVRQRVLAIDFAAQGNDMCVATILDRVSPVHWELTEQVQWNEANAMISIGKIVDLIGKYSPQVTILDVGGMGHVVHSRLEELKLDIKRFDGASTELVDSRYYVNARAAGYYLLKEWFDEGYIIMQRKDKQVIMQLEKIKRKYRSDGRKVLQPKEEMKKAPPVGCGQSPDNADSLMMAVWAAKHYMHAGAAVTPQYAAKQTVQRRSTSRRKR